MTRQEALVSFIAQCDPGAPPPGDTYIGRVPPLSQRMGDMLVPKQTARVLLLGQNGVGKTTELIRLEQTLQYQFFTVRPPIDTVLDLGDLGWHDLFVFGVLWASSQLSLGKERAVAALTEALRPLEQRREEVTTTSPSPLEAITGLGTLGRGGPKKTTTVTHTEGGPPEPTALQRFRNSHAEVRRTIAHGPAQFWDLATAVVRLIEERTAKPVVLLIDGLEKMTDHAAKTLFYDQGRYLRDLPCRAVITAPLTVSFEAFFGDVEEHFLFTVRLRALSLAEDNGRKFMTELAVKRGALEVSTAELLEEAVANSGGLPRQLLQILAAAANQAYSDGLDQVERTSLLRGRQRVAERWQYQLSPKDYVELQKPDEERTAWVRASLLRLAALIEYDRPDGSLIIDINPLVRTLLERRAQGTAHGTPGH